MLDSQCVGVAKEVNKTRVPGLIKNLYITLGIDSGHSYNNQTMSIDKIIFSSLIDQPIRRLYLFV